MIHRRTDPEVMHHIYQLVAREVRAARNGHELAERLHRHGYGYRTCARGRVLITIPHGLELGPLPE